MKSKLFMFCLLIGTLFYSHSMSSQIVINEVYPSGTVELKNMGTAAVDLTNYWLCDRPTYRRIGTLSIASGNVSNLAPDELLVIDNFDFLDPAEDELALYNSSSFGSATAIMDFVQWGAPSSTTRAGLAVSAGLWDAATSVTPAIATGESLQFNGSTVQLSTPADFFLNTPSIGAENMMSSDACEALASDIIINPSGINNTTSVAEDGLSAVICVDSIADPIAITMVNPEDSQGANAGWIITDATTGTILGLPAAGPFDLNGAGLGICQIWYIRYEDGLLGKEVDGNINDLEGCFDLSNPVDVIREAADGGTVSIDLDATGNPNGTTTFNGDTEAVICVDGQMDPIVVIHENPGAENLSYRYVITDAATGLILNVVATNSISLDPAGPGTCEIWGWSYRGVPNNGLDQIGQPLSSLDDLDCSDISDNAITVIREAADGGTVSIDLDATGNPNGTTTFNGDTEAVICVDGQMDPIVVIHENPGAENLSYRYVITDAATGLILNVVATNSISLDAAGPGTCEIWGWSYRGVPNNGLDQIGQPLSSLDDLDCSDISDNAITVIREVANGGTVAIDIDATEAAGGSVIINSDTEAVICLDTQVDPIVVSHENDAPNLSYRYVITDAATGLILNVVNTNSIDLNGVAAGTCEIWGWSYRGVPGNGLDQIGQPLSSLDDLDCSDISDNSVTVIRQEHDVVSEISINIDATGNPNGTTTFDNEFTAIICGDTQADPLVIDVTTVAADLPYTLVIYDIDSFLITDVIDVDGFSAIVDVNGPNNGGFEILGLSGILPSSPEDILGTDIGDFADLVFNSECVEFSITSVIVLREVADGGTVAIDLDATGNPNGTTTFNGDTEAVICVDGQMDPIVVIHENPGAENLSYRYVITDAATGLILNVVATNSISLDAAGPGTCEIWGWSYRGVPNNGLDQIGQPLSSLDDLDCSDISDNAITVIREAADGGTVSLANGELEATICAGDDIPDPLEVVHTTTAENLTYLYVITDSDPDQTILGIGGSTIDLEGSGEGVCRIWGWSYRGLAGGTEFIGFPLADLQAEPCSEISENFIEVTRLTGEDCLLLSTDDVIRDEFEISMYPNPAQNFVNIDFSNATNSDIEVSVYDVTGKLIKNVTLNSGSSQMDVSDFSTGAYLVQIINKDSGTSITKQLVKR